MFDLHAYTAYIMFDLFHGLARTRYCGQQHSVQMPNGQ
jgi:hypothetical protein